MDVWSEEGVGTEIRVSFPAEMTEDDPRLLDAAQEMQSFKIDEPDLTLPKVALLGFESSHRGVRLLRKVLHTQITGWWGFDIMEDSKQGEIFILVGDSQERQGARGGEA